MYCCVARVCKHDISIAFGEAHYKVRITLVYDIVACEASTFGTSVSRSKVICLVLVII